MKFRCVQIAVAVAVVAAPLALGITPQPRANPLAGPARAVAQAKDHLDDVRKLMFALRRKIELVYEGKPDFKAAKDTVEKAKSEYDAEARKIVARLEATPAYQQLVLTRDKTLGIIDPSTTQPAAKTTSDDDAQKPSPEELQKARSEHVQAVFAMKAMEKQAEEADTTYATLKQKYDDARMAWDALQAQVDDAVKLDPAYPQLKQQLDQAEAAYKQARDAYAAAAKSAHPPTPVRR